MFRVGEPLLKLGEPHTGFVSLKDLDDLPKWAENNRPNGEQLIVDGDDGTWNEAAICPDEYYVCGLKAKFGMPVYGDKTGVSGLKMKCCHRDRAVDDYNGTGGSLKADQIELEPVTGDIWQGKWYNWVMCPYHEFVTDFRVKYVPNRGNHDDVEVANIEVDCRRLCCNKGTRCAKENHLGISVGPPDYLLPQEWIHPHGTNSDSLLIENSNSKFDDTYITKSNNLWENHELYCGAGRALCGLRPKFSFSRSLADKTGITGFKAVCCNGIISDKVDRELMKKEGLNCW